MKVIGVLGVLVVIVLVVLCSNENFNEDARGGLPEPDPVEEPVCDNGVCERGEPATCPEDCPQSDENDDEDTKGGESRDDDSTSIVTTREWMGQKWHIDENHLMYWNGEPFIPYGVFAPKSDDIIFLKKHNMNMVNFWVDNDYLLENPGSTTEDHIAWVNERIKTYCDAGLGVILLLAVDKANKNAATLFDASTRKEILDSWTKYVSVAQHSCLRGVILWNEINAQFTWPDTYSDVEYGVVLGEYADAVKELLADYGEIPVFFKIADAEGSYETFGPVIEGAKKADGLLVDVWPTKPDDSRAAWLFKFIWGEFNQGQTHTTAYFIGEGGKGLGASCTDSKLAPWDHWPPFVSEKEAKGILTDYAAYGLNGIIYNGPLNSYAASCSYETSYEYLKNLQKDITRLMLNTEVDFSNAPNKNSLPETVCGELPSCLDGSSEPSCLDDCLATGESEDECEGVCGVEELNQPCTVGQESGKTCDSVDTCSSGEFVDGCCIVGECE